MAIFTKSELAHAVGKGKSTISMNITRGNLIEHDGMINDSDPKNQKTIEKWLKSIGGNYKAPAEIKESRKKANADRNKKEKAPKVEKIKSRSTDDLDDQKKKAEINLKLEQIEHLQLKSAKLKGENVPTKLVEGLFIMLGTSFQTEYRDASENLLSQLAHECKIGSKMHAKYKDMFTKMINEAHSNGVEIVLNELKAIADDASGKIAMEND